MTAADPILLPASHVRQPRARGEVRVCVQRRGARTVLKDFYQSGSLKCLFPRTGADALTAVTLNTAGGLTGGDRISAAFDVGPRSALTITTQAAERAYRAQPGEVARLTNDVRVAQGGSVAWLPQETLLYDGATLSRRLRFDLARSARALIVEPIVFGRAAMGERLNHLRFTDRIDIFKDGVLQVADRTRLVGSVHDILLRRGVADGAGAMATLCLIAPKACTLLDAVRDCLPDSGGASLLDDDCLLVRTLAPDSHALRKAIIPLIARLHDGPLPRTWTL